MPNRQIISFSSSCLKNLSIFTDYPINNSSKIEFTCIYYAQNKFDKKHISSSKE